MYKIGSRDKNPGGPVSRIQKATGAAIDGDYGPDTARHVKAWQRARTLRGTGMVDAKTFALMFPKPKPVPKERAHVVVAAITNARRYLKYGLTAAAVRKRLVSITLFGHKVSVHKLVAPRMLDWQLRVREHEAGRDKKPWMAKDVQSFCWRLIRGTKHGTRSMHSWAIAVDMDPATNAMGQSKHTIPDYVFTCARDAGFACGVDWKTRPDPMHVEWRG